MVDFFYSHLSYKEELDLSESLLNEEEKVWMSKKVVSTGALVFDSDFRVLPLISEFLSTSLRNNKISQHTAKTYSKNLIYFLTYLKQRPEFKNTTLDEAFLTVTKFSLLNSSFSLCSP